MDLEKVSSDRHLWELGRLAIDRGNIWWILLKLFFLRGVKHVRIYMVIFFLKVVKHVWKYMVKYWFVGRPEGTCTSRGCLIICYYGWSNSTCEARDRHGAREEQLNYGGRGWRAPVVLCWWWRLTNYYTISWMKGSMSWWKLLGRIDRSEEKKEGKFLIFERDVIC